MTAAAVVGDPQAVEAYLSTPDGRRVAREVARSIFEDEDRIAAYEFGDDLGLASPVVRELDRLIDRRNREDRP